MTSCDYADTCRAGLQPRHLTPETRAWIYIHVSHPVIIINIPPQSWMHIFEIKNASLCRHERHLLSAFFKKIIRTSRNPLVSCQKIERLTPCGLLNLLRLPSPCGWNSVPLLLFLSCFVLQSSLSPSGWSAVVVWQLRLTCATLLNLKLASTARVGVIISEFGFGSRLDRGRRRVQQVRPARRLSWWERMKLKACAAEIAS